jgi:hypothetical protein
MAKKSMKKGGCWSGGCSGGRRRRTMRGGVYGFSGEVIAPGTLVASAPYTGPVNSSGTPIPDPTDPKGGYTGLGGRRRRRGGVIPGRLTGKPKDHDVAVNMAVQDTMKMKEEEDAGVSEPQLVSNAEAVARNIYLGYRYKNVSAEDQAAADQAAADAAAKVRSMLKTEGGRRGSRKGRRGSRKTRRGTRKMRGGASQMSMGGVGYGYTGTGVGGLADATQYVKPGNPI